MSEHTPDILEPDEQFVDALELQLRQGLRRRAMLDSADHRRRGISRKGINMLATASLMLLSLMLGAAGTYSVVHQDPAPQRELHIQKASILLERAQVRLEQRKTDLAEMLPLVEQGLADDRIASRYRQSVAQGELEVQRRELDLQETGITGRAAVDDLTGPLIAGQDFITQRLNLQQQSADLRLQAEKAALGQVEAMAQGGLISDPELIGARAELNKVEQDLACVRERIRLRAAFLAGDLAAAEVELGVMAREAETEHAAAQADTETARLKLQRIATLHGQGAATDGELRAAETGVREAESNLALADLQLKMIRQRLDALTGQE